MIEKNKFLHGDECDDGFALSFEVEFDVLTHAFHIADIVDGNTDGLVVGLDDEGWCDLRIGGSHRAHRLCRCLVGSDGEGLFILLSIFGDLFSMRQR